MRFTNKTLYLLPLPPFWWWLGEVRAYPLPLLKNVFFGGICPLESSPCFHHRVYASCAGIIFQSSLCSSMVGQKNSGNKFAGKKELYEA